MIRELGHHCSSTALAASMHTHSTAMLSFLWRNGNKAPEPLLRRVAAERLMLVSTGGSDWLAGSGRLEKVEGGYQMTGRKIFASGVPAGHILMTTGIFDDPKERPDGDPLRPAAERTGREGARQLAGAGHARHRLARRRARERLRSRRGHGGRAAAAGQVAPRRARRRRWWRFPSSTPPTSGVAEAARDVALELARKRKNDPNVAYLAGEMENLLVTAQLAHASMVDLSRSAKPGPETSSAMLIRRTLVANGVLRTAEKALEVAGGAGFFRSSRLERLFRDVQACRYHPLPEKQQTRLTGRRCSGLELDG